MSISAQIRIRRDTAANFTSANPTLALGEIAYETDTFRFKVGTGSTAWTALGYAAQNPTSLTVTDTTPATSTTSGALRVAGGISTQDGLYTGTDAVVNGLRVGRGSNVASNTNTSVGLGAGSALLAPSGVQGLSNVFIGLAAGDNVTTGYENVFIGANSGGSQTGPTFNVAIGSNALFSLNGGGGQHVAVGLNCMYETTGGNSNTAIGCNAGRGNQTGINNVFIGDDAGRNSAAGSQITAASSSVFIGQDARPNASGETNQIVIGRAARGNGSNTTTLGTSSTTGTFIPAGNLTLSNGNLILGTAGKGIDFSADANAAGMTSELLDDYEEGTYTPYLEFNGQRVSMTYTTQVGSYTKIGRMVHVTGHIVLSNKGTSTGHATITFPFAIANETSAAGAFAVQVNAVTYGGSIMPTLLPNNTRGHLYDVSEAGLIGLITDADFDNTSDIRWTATYRV